LLGSGFIFQLFCFLALHLHYFTFYNDHFLQGKLGLLLL